MKRTPKLITGFIAVLALYLTSPVHAQWVLQEEEDPFGDDHLTMAFTAKSNRGFAVRCRGEDLQLLFMPNEQADESTITMMGSIKPELLVRIDSDEIVTFAPLPQSVDGKLVLSTEVSHDFANEIADARKRIAVTVKWVGQNFGATSFGVSGSGKTIRAVLKACPVEES